MEGNQNIAVMQLDLSPLRSIYTAPAHINLFDQSSININLIRAPCEVGNLIQQGMVNLVLVNMP